jgi:hypothetical protein
LNKKYSFATVSIKQIQSDNYPDQEFAIAKLGYLSTRPNAHDLLISEKVLRKCADSVLGKWLVADMTNVIDAGTHSKQEHIVGYVPTNQDVEFVTDKDGYLRAYVDVIISKIYAKDFCLIFEEDNNRAVSVEMFAETSEDDDSIVTAFNIVGVTVLGKDISPSCPQSDIVITRFSNDQINQYYNQIKHSEMKSLTMLEKFSIERKMQMAEAKTYKVNKSKESMSNTPWENIDKTSLRNKIMDATNKSSLVKDVYLLVESGWEDAPSEKLKYPVMELKGDTFVYNRNALASALGYAKKENETSVISKLEKIYQKLGLDEGKEDNTKMAKEIKFAAVDLNDMWSQIHKMLSQRMDRYYWIVGIYEENNQKFVIIGNDLGERYRIDFSYTTDGLTLSDNMTKVLIDWVETDQIQKFACPENFEKITKFDEIEGRKAWGKVIKKVQDHEGDKVYVDSIEDNHIIYTKDGVRYRVQADIKVDKDDKTVDADIKWDTVSKDKDQKMAKMSEDEIKDELARLQKEIEKRDNIIMDKEQELNTLKQFKESVEKKEQAMCVEAVLTEIKNDIDAQKLSELRTEGLSCNFAELDGWSNKVKALAFEMSKKQTNNNEDNDLWSFSHPIASQVSKSVWDRI